MATATVEEVQLLKTLRWWDGFVIALCNPGFLLGSLGYTLGIFGAAGSISPVVNEPSSGPCERTPITLT